jgi:predicted tellurium resistance membrane protein TerC
VFDPRVLLTPEGLASLVSLAVMEIVLGIDNIIFVAILSQKVAPPSRKRVRRLGIGLALVLRIGLLLMLSWLMGLTRPLFHLLGQGLELANVDDDEGPGKPAPVSAGFAITLVQILLLDVVFSLDSVITAVGMAQAVVVMITAMVIAVVVMLVFADAISEFIGRYPSMKVLALAFLLLIGFLLVADAFGHHINKGYVYFAMAFSLGVELVNMRVRKKSRAKGSRS